MDQTKLIQDLQDQVARLQKDLSDLSGVVYKNNFGSTQSFNKDCVFNARLKIPHYASAPTVAEVGDLIEVGGKLYICTVASSTSPTFTLVGSQT